MHEYAYINYAYMKADLNEITQTRRLYVASSSEIHVIHIKFILNSFKMK